MSKYLTQELQSKFPKWISEILRGAWRGALGGMIGPLVFVLFLAAKRPNDAIAIAHLPIILPTTAAVGALIGVLIGFLQFVARLRFGRFAAVVVAATFPACLWMIHLYVRDNDPQEFSWPNSIGWSIFIGLIIGALPGFLAARKKIARGK